MDIDLCIAELKQNSKSEYEVSVPVYEKYKELLLAEIKDNPKNIRAVCLLAMVCIDLRYDAKDVLKNIKHVFKVYKDELSDDEYAMLATDIAYIYTDEIFYRGKAIFNLLKSAVQRNPTFPETYHALAMLFYNNENYRDALPQLKRASVLSDKFRYHYNYANCLYKCGYANEAIPILQKLSGNWSDGWRGVKAYLFLGYIYAQRNCMKEAKAIAYDLFSANFDASKIEECDIDGLMFSSDLAGLMFLIGDFEKCAKLFENDDLPFEESCMSRYFYSLKELKQQNKAKAKLLELMEWIENDISNICEVMTEWEPKDIEKYIYLENQDKASIQKAYDNIFVHNKKPEGDYITNLIEKYTRDGCHYIECPRHYLKGT